MKRRGLRATPALLAVALASCQPEDSGITGATPQSVHPSGASVAAAYFVSNTDDDGAGSLRQAILDANANPGADVIDATGVTGTITVNPANYFLVITDDVTINGPGQANLTISGGGLSRIFWIQNGNVTIQDLTLADGFAKGGTGGGGGMGAGGAIFMHEGKQGTNPLDVLSGNIDLHLVDVTLQDNVAQGGAGGGFNTGLGNVPGGGGMGGNGDSGGASGGVLGSAAGQYGGSVTDATLSARGTNGGIAVFGSGGKEGFNDAGFGGGGGGNRDGGFGGGGGGAVDGGGAFGRGGFGGGGGGAGTDNNFLNNGGARGGFGGGGGGLHFRCSSCSNGDAGGDDGQGGFGGGNGDVDGGGGMGAGGAIFVASGNLSLENVTFENNDATGGTGGNPGKGLGGALFLFNKGDNGGIAAPGTTNDPNVTSLGVTYSGNSASDDAGTAGNNDDVYGTVTAIPSLSIDDVQQIEQNAGTTTFSFTVSLSSPALPGGVTFDIETQDNSATDGDNDYDQKPLTSQTISASGTSYTFDVTVNGDVTVESDETFFVNVTNVVGAAVTDAQGEGTIQNDDTPPAAQSIDFDPLGDKTFGDPNFDVSAIASSGLPVSFGSDTPGVCTLAGTTVTIVAAGGCTIRASQGGDASWAPATDVTQSFTVNQASQAINFGALGNKTLGDPPFGVAANATSALPVSFGSDTPGVCTVAGTTVTIVAAGGCTIRASQGGDANWLAATDVTQSFTVTSPAQSPQTINFGALGGKLYGATPFGVSATATSGLPVSFASLTAPVCTVSGTTVTLKTAGLCTIRATQGGNASWLPAPAVDRSFTVGYGVANTWPPANSKFISGTTIPVWFQLTDARGKPIPFPLALSLGCAVKVAFSGGTPVCAGYFLLLQRFQASVKTPSGLTRGATYPIVITVTAGATTVATTTINVIAR